MNLLQELLEAQVDDVTSRSEQPNKLPEGTLDTIKKNIRIGAKPDKNGVFQPWANSLHLVHKAYEVANVERPTPDMKELWKQYEEMIQFAVKELSKTRGIDGSWRMSAYELDKHV